MQFGWDPQSTIHENSAFKLDRVGNARIFLMTADTLESGTSPYSMQFSSAPYTVSRAGITTLGPFVVGKFRDSVTSVADNDNGQIPKDFTLSQNYPNPFNPLTTIEYNLPDAEFVTLTVYDVLGKVVATLVNEEQPEGKYKVPFNAGNLSTGIYLYRITAGRSAIVKKMLLLK